MTRPSQDPAVLVVDAGSHSLRLVVVAADGHRLQEESTESPPDSPEATGCYDGFLEQVGTVDAVGYRVVHGGPSLTRAALVDDTVLDQLRGAVPMAPMHLPPVIDTIRALRGRLPRLPHVVAFDTAFHATIPEVARTYALPVEWRRRWDLRRYGFHGLSYASALPRAAALLGRRSDQLQMVLAHLGGGSSVCAVRDGQSLWTSMGASPLEGLVMGTRSGSVDPGLLLTLVDAYGLSISELRQGLERHSGLLGLSAGRSSDTRELVSAAADGHEDARLALDIFAFRARQGIAEAAVCLDRLDALVFTGEIGVDQPELRQAICAGLAPLGLGDALEPVVDRDAVVSPPDVRVPVVVLTVGEDLQVAFETRRLLAGA